MMRLAGRLCWQRSRCCRPIDDRNERLGRPPQGKMGGLPGELGKVVTAWCDLLDTAESLGQDFGRRPSWRRTLVAVFGFGVRESAEVTRADRLLAWVTESQSGPRHIGSVAAPLRLRTACRGRKLLEEQKMAPSYERVRRGGPDRSTG